MTSAVIPRNLSGLERVCGGVSKLFVSLRLVQVNNEANLNYNNGKMRQSNVLDYNGVIALGKQFPSTKANRFIEWFTYSDEKHRLFLLLRGK
jgi:hypothetical protein